MTNTFSETLKTLVKSMILLFVLVSIANFTVELLLTARTHFLNTHKSILKNINITEDADIPFLEQHSKDIFYGNSKTSFSISIGVERDFSDALSFNGSTDGRRLTSTDLLINKKYNGILLGSSQAWGYFAKDTDTLSHQLMNSIGNIAIDNYSLLGVTLEQSFHYWQKNKSHLHKQDFIIIVGGVADIINYCNKSTYNKNIRDATATTNIGLINFYNRLNDRIRKYKNNMGCYNEEQANEAVSKILNSIELFLKKAREDNLSILIVIPPVSVYGSPNLSQLKPNKAFYESKENYNLAYDILNKSVNQLNSKSVVNLMHIFDDEDNYYIDLESHFNPKGHAKLANEIAKKIPEGFLK